MESSLEIERRKSFLGFTISGSGIEPDNRLVNKVRKIHPPQTVKEVEQFCGLVNFYGRFIPNFTSKTAPISELRKRSEAEFQWTEKCQRAFERLKSELASKPVVQPSSLEKEVTITTDASEKAIDGVLSQEWQPVICVSKTLSQAEQRYSNIEREALAIVFVVKRLKQFLLGRNFNFELIIVLWISYLLQTRNSQKPYQQESQDEQFRLWPSIMTFNTMKGLRFPMPMS